MKLSPLEENDVYRIGQEALTNALRHSKSLTATRAVIAEFPEARIIVLTNSEDEELNSLAAGAKALVQKDAHFRELIATICSVHNMV